MICVYELENGQFYIEETDNEEKFDGFVFTGIPEFDKKDWEKILEEKGLQGLS